VRTVVLSTKLIGLFIYYKGVYGLYYFNGFLITYLDSLLTFFCPLEISLYFGSPIKSFISDLYSLYNCFNNSKNNLPNGHFSFKGGSDCYEEILFFLIFYELLPIKCLKYCKLLFSIDYKRFYSFVFIVGI